MTKTKNIHETDGGSVTEVLPKVMTTMKFEVPNVRTVAELIHLYQTDPISTYHKMRYQTRMNHANLLTRLVQQLGAVELADIHARDLKRWHQEWYAGGHGD